MDRNESKCYFIFSEVERLEKELRVRDDIIHELEVRLTLPNFQNSDSIEVQNLQTQLDALQTILAKKDNEIEALKNGDDELNTLKCDFASLQSEQEDLLMMLSDQDLKIREYKKKLKLLGALENGGESDDEDLSD